MRVSFDLDDIFDRTPFPRYINNRVQWDPDIHPLANINLFSFSLPFLSLVVPLFSPFSILLDVIFVNTVAILISLAGSMQPVTVVKRFRHRDAPSIPLPENIDEDITSQASSWLVISRGSQQPTVDLGINPSEIACQTMASPQPFYERPRSKLKKRLHSPSDVALQPPVFLPKSKLPKLQYGGLQPPHLHCFTSSSGATPDPKPSESPFFIKPTAKSLPSPATFRKATTGLHSTIQKDESNAARARSLLREIFFDIGFSANLCCEIHESAFIEQHIDGIADSLGTSGLLMYVQVWNHWACWCQLHTHIPAEAPLYLILDYLHASDHLRKKKDSQPSRTRMMTHIKALRWIALKLDLPVLQALQSQTVSEFLKSQTRIPFERSEASPIPLAVLAAWEKRILSDQSTFPEIITLGCFLLATMASLRFRDLLRTKPESLSIQGHILRGISWRTKTSVSGQPWGVCCLGITTRPSVQYWAFRFLEAIQIGIDKSRTHWGPQWSPDFLFPSWTDSIPFSSPCSYHHALALIRFYTQCSWLEPALLTPEEARHLSTHSTSSTAHGGGGSFKNRKLIGDWLL